MTAMPGGEGLLALRQCLRAVLPAILWIAGIARRHIAAESPWLPALSLLLIRHRRGGWTMMVLAVLLLSAQNPPPPAPPVGEPLLVPRAGFDCLVKNIDRVKLKHGEVRVDIRSCPTEEVEGFGDIAGHHSNAVEQMLVLDEGRLSCIRRNKHDVSKFAVKLDGFYRIDLKSCTRPAG